MTPTKRSRVGLLSSVQASRKTIDLFRRYAAQVGLRSPAFLAVLVSHWSKMTRSQRSEVVAQKYKESANGK